MRFATLLTFVAAAALSVLAVPVEEAAADHVSKYDGVKVLRVPTGADVKPIEALIESLDLERWTTTPTANSHVDVEVPQDKHDEFVAAANAISATANIKQPIVTMHEDLGKSIRDESAPSPEAKSANKLAGLANEAYFAAYHSYADHVQFLKDLVTTFPSNSKLVSSGTSLNGNSIAGINIFGSGGSGTKPAIIVHGNVHAREWITGVTTEGIAYSLLSNYTTSAEVKAYVDKYDFYFFPIVNPDGFLFTQSSTRLWRKNRSAPPSGSTCYGTDINRNWAHTSWGQSGGASTSPCAEDYKGSAAASAPETKALAAFINTRRAGTGGVKLFLDLHSYSQLFMGPYGYSCTKNAADITEHNSLGSGFVSSLKAVYGTSFTRGPICTTIYQASGGGVDYNYDNGVKYSFTAELRDTGANGFVLPPAQIRPSVIETYAGFKYLLANIK